MIIEEGIIMLEKCRNLLFKRCHCDPESSEMKGTERNLEFDVLVCEAGCELQETGGSLQDRAVISASTPPQWGAWLHSVQKHNV